VIYLLDNNVLSELWKPAPDPAVIAFCENSDWYVPVPVIAEIQEGAEASPSEKRKQEITARLDDFLLRHPGVVLSWDSETARTWGRMKHSREVKLKPQPLWDSLLDAMAVRYGATVATRNKADFRHAQTFSPWDFQPPKPEAPPTETNA
jgi:predicted nucleic acid-binding protein